MGHLGALALTDIQDAPAPQGPRSGRESSQVDFAGNFVRLRVAVHKLKTWFAARQGERDLLAHDLSGTAAVGLNFRAEIGEAAIQQFAPSNSEKPQGIVVAVGEAARFAVDHYDGF